MQENFIRRLYLSICLRMCHYSEPRLAPQVVQVVGHFVGVKLPNVIKYHCSRETEARDDVFPSELLHFRGGDRGDSFGLYPLSEVINSYKETLTLTGRSGKRSENVHPPCGQGQVVDDWGKRGGRLPPYW